LIVHSYHHATGTAWGRGKEEEEMEGRERM